MKKSIYWNKQLSFVLVAGLILTALNGCGGADNTTANNTENSNGTGSLLDTIKSRGNVICGVNGQLPGFSFVDENGEYSGMDAEICRAVAAALFDDPTQVEFRDLSAQERFTAVQSGEVDLVNRNTTWTISRDTSVGMEFAPTTFYDGQGIMVRTADGIDSLEALNNRSICVLSGTTNEQNLADQMRKRGVSYQPVVFEDVDALYAAYDQGRCAAVTSDRSQLTARRAILASPDDHEVSSLVLSKEPLGPMVANGDAQWFDAVKWITFALIQAEEFGINSQNLVSFENTEDPQIFWVKKAT